MLRAQTASPAAGTRREGANRLVHGLFVYLWGCGAGYWAEPARIQRAARFRVLAAHLLYHRFRDLRGGLFGQCVARAPELSQAHEFAGTVPGVGWQAIFLRSPGPRLPELGRCSLPPQGIPLSL